jgi:signal transduction histidine kinase
MIKKEKSIPDEDRQIYRCFLALPFGNEFHDVREAVILGIKKADFQVVSFEQTPVSFAETIQDVVIRELTQADCIIADITETNPNVFYELGLAQAMGKGLFLISHEGGGKNIPTDLQGFRILLYDDTLSSLNKLSKMISISLQEYRLSPQRSRVQYKSPFSIPFFIDWERLGEREAENLCRELLAAMGFQQIEWGKFSKEIDMVAEFPRKDPDGFEYRELWLISMRDYLGSKFLHMITVEPDYFIRSLEKYSEKFERYLSGNIETPLTFLIINYRKNPESEEIEMLHERLGKRRFREPSGYNLRIRFWEQAYLTSLINRFPQIGYKYFSDEGRIRSETRKSYEELYNENSDLVARQAKLIANLEEEKNRRIRAERDAVWKDISFSAAHKIGNPIFAIETDLDPLNKRIREQRTAEAEEVVENIRSSLEKSKAFVEQFKSLARAQEIKPVPTLLRPILEDACRSLTSKDISCKVECPSELTVLADPDRLGECVDELVTNAVHFFDKPEKKIEFRVVHPVPEPLPDFLDSDRAYVLIHAKDNGPGIQVSHEEKIFDAFFTTYAQGTGLGLALVQRIIDGHGGGIIENGIPGQGADFEVYLPLPDKKTVKRRLSSKSRSRK